MERRFRSLCGVSPHTKSYYKHNVLNKYNAYRFHCMRIITQHTNTKYYSHLPFGVHETMVLLPQKNMTSEYQTFQIQKFIIDEAVENFILDFISSRLDNGNSLLYGLPN